MPFVASHISWLVCPHCDVVCGVLSTTVLHCVTMSTMHVSSPPPPDRCTRRGEFSHKAKKDQDKINRAISAACGEAEMEAVSSGGNGGGGGGGGNSGSGEPAGFADLVLQAWQQISTNTRKQKGHKGAKPTPEQIATLRAEKQAQAAVCAHDSD